jgi:peptidyl-tRNA hydrolase
MNFMNKIGEFILASGRFINSDKEFTLAAIDDIDISLDSLKYCTAGDGKRNMGNDFIAVGKDFKKATEQAKAKVKDGKTATAK